MQRIHMVRLLGEDLPIELLGLGKPASLMVAQGFFENLFDTEGRHGNAKYRSALSMVQAEFFLDMQPNGCIIDSWLDQWMMSSKPWRIRDEDCFSIDCMRRTGRRWESFVGIWT